MNRLTELAVAKRSVTLLLTAAIFLAGASAWGSLQQELIPDVDFPVITVIAPYPGAGAEDIATQVAEPIERAISGVPRLESLRSTSTNSVALVVAEFAFGTDSKEVKAAIEDNLADAGLPEGVAASVSSLNINASPVIIASISAAGGGSLDRAAEIARSEIVPSLLGLEGVAGVDLTGGTERQVLVTLDPAAIAEAGVSSQQVIGVLRANNLTLPSGQLVADGDKIPVSTIGTFSTIDEISELVVGVKMSAGGQPGGPAGPPTPVTLGQIATIELTDVATTGYARTNGSPSLSLTVTKTAVANTVDVAALVMAELDAAAATHTSALTVTVVSNLSTFITDSQDGLVREGGLGALFAVGTIFLFLFSLRSTIVAAISLPMSVLAALVIMQLSSVSLNIMSLAGLAVAIGRVVDDAIVVLENIYRHRALGDDRLTSVVRGTREVATAITASTLTTVAVFLPIGFVGGFISQFFLPFALTVTFALLASLVIALTVVPVFAYLLIDRVKSAVDETGEPTNSFWVHVYTPAITAALRNRWTKLAVLGIAAVLFAGSATLVTGLPTQFFNTGSEKILRVAVIPPAGAGSELVLDRATAAETIVRGNAEVILVQTSVPPDGDTGFRALTAAFSGQPANTATLTVRLDPSVNLDTATQEILDALASIRTDGFDVAVAEAQGFSSNSLNVVVSAGDPGLVETASAAIVAALSDRPELLNLASDLVKATPEIRIIVDPNKAIAVGMTAAQVAGEVRGALTAATATTASIDGSDPIEINLRLDPGSVASVEALRALPVGTVARVPLGSIATVERVTVQGSITRIDGAPSASISAEIASEDTGAVSESIQAELDALDASGAIPAGVNVQLAGVSQQQAEAFGGLFSAMAVAILLVYVMMVLAFNSLITPFIIMFTLPLATIGAFPALVLTGRPLGVSAMIGFLMLIGIVVTNAIVLLDLVERLRAEGHSTRDALILGGRTRVRPILMTAVATILALVPLAAGFNEGSIVAAELGTVVIGGLLSSTFLTLLVIPVVYSLLNSAKERVSRLLGYARTRPSSAG